MLIFPDPNVETEYTDPNGSVWEFNGTGWVRQCDCDGSGGGSGSTDPDWGKVELLINGEEGLADSSGKNTVTVNGDVSIGNSVVKYGSGSIDLTQTGYLSVDSLPAFNTEFTVEAWFYATSLAQAQIIAHWRNADFGWTLSTASSGTGAITSSISHDGTSVGGVLTTTDTAGINQWHHVALTWDGSTYQLFLDGVPAPTAYNSTQPPYAAPTADFTVGARVFNAGASQYLDGHVDDVRVTIGKCRYTGNFNPPEEHPTSVTRTVYKEIDLTQAQDDSNDSEPLGDDE
jgi:hypothetical protein